MGRGAGAQSWRGSSPVISGIIAISVLIAILVIIVIIVIFKKIIILLH